MKIQQRKIVMAGLGVIGRNHMLNIADHVFSAVNFLDARRSAWLPANLIQARRDYFRIHTYMSAAMPKKHFI